MQRKSVVCTLALIIYVISGVAFYKIGHALGSAVTAGHWSDLLYRWRTEDRLESTWHVERIDGNVFELRCCDLSMHFRFEGYNVAHKNALSELQSIGWDGGWLVTPTSVTRQNSSVLVVGKASIWGSYIDKELVERGILVVVPTENTRVKGTDVEN